MAALHRVLVVILAVAVAAEQASYTPRVRRRPMLSAQDGPDSDGAESELDQVLQGPPSDFSPSPQIPDGPRSDDEAAEIGGLTVQDPPKGWPFSDMALQEKFQEQMMQEETGQQQVWSEPPEQAKPARQVYRQGRVLDGGRQGRKEHSSREQESASGSGEQQSYRDYPKKKRIVKPSHSHGARIRQSPKHYQQEAPALQQEEQVHYHQEQFEQKQHIEQPQFTNSEQVQQHEEQPSRHQREQPKRNSKRRPGPATNSGGPSAVSVGYSLNFDNQEAGLKSGQGSLGLVQSEVVHGDGAVSYSNTQIGNTHSGHLRPRPDGADSIDGRPIYVPPISSSGYSRIPHQSSPYSFPSTQSQSSEHESLPSPAALIGEPEITGGNYSPETISVVKSNNLFQVEQRPESPQIITQFDSSPQGPPAQYEPSVKPTKPPTILHINDGTDFKWKNLGNGVEISAAITPNGLQGGYRESIPIQEDNEEDTPLFEKQPSIFAPEIPKPISPQPTFGHSIIPGSQFDESNGIFAGQSGENIEGGIQSFAKPELLPTPQGLTSNHLLEEQPKTPFPEHQSHTPPQSFNRRPNIYSHSFADVRPEKVNEDLLGNNVGFPKFPEMNKIYYIPSGKPGTSPIPAVIMPLSVLKHITGGLDPQFTSQLGQDITTAEFMKMLSHNDLLPEAPVSSPAPEQRPVKPRPHGFNPNKPHQSHEGHAPNRGARNHHRYQQSFNTNKYNQPPYGVKVTKSVPIYEQHSMPAQNEVSWTMQPPKQSSQVQHYNIPLEAYESLRPSTTKGRVAPNHYNMRETHQEGYTGGSGRQQYRMSRQNGHQQSREVAQTERPHGDRDGESFAVTSSYRIGGPSSHSGWKQQQQQQGRN